MEDLAGSVAAITSAAGGVGFALAREAVRRGMAVAISDIREDALEAPHASWPTWGAMC